MKRKRSPSFKHAATSGGRERIADTGVSLTEASPHPDLVGVLEDDPPLPVILIELDPALSGGYFRNRFDVVVRGRVVSSVAIEEIRLQCQDQILSTASYSLPDRAAAAMDDGAAWQRAFQFSLPRGIAGMPEQCAIQIVGRTQDGFERAETFVLALDPMAATPAVLTSGPAGAAATIGSARPFATMYIERGTIDDAGNLTVDGWAVALGPILAIQVFAGGRRVGSARTGIARDDVGLVHPAYPNSRLAGFTLTARLDQADFGATSIRVQVICSNGCGLEETIPVERTATGPMNRSVPQAAGSPEPDGRSMGGLGRRGAPPPVRSGTDNDGAGSDGDGRSAGIEMFCDVAELRGDGTLLV